MEIACVLVQRPKPQWAQTYVLFGKKGAWEPFKLFAWKCDAHAWLLRYYAFEEETYLICTFCKGSNTISSERHFRDKVQEYGGDAFLEWIQPLTERLQSKFGWRTKPKTLLALCNGDTDFVSQMHEESWVHPWSPLPFYVLPQKKPSDEEKLAWILQEVPGVADLGVFAKTFLVLFGANFTMKSAQKATVIRLWGHHVGRELEKGMDLEAEELEIFELAWDKKARARCRLCKGEVEEVQAAYFHARAPECQRPDCTIPQARCRACETESEADAGWHTCKPCQREPLPTPTGTDSALLRSLKRQHEMLRIHNNVWQTDIGEATVKKRKRT